MSLTCQLQLGAERFRAPEILFNPELIGEEYAGVHQVVVDSINRVDLDLRKSLFSNIVLSGGSTLCKGISCSFESPHRPSLTHTARIWRPASRGGKETCSEGCQNQNICPS